MMLWLLTFVLVVLILYVLISALFVLNDKMLENFENKEYGRVVLNIIEMTIIGLVMFFIVKTMDKIL